MPLIDNLDLREEVSPLFQSPSLKVAPVICPN